LRTLVGSRPSRTDSKSYSSTNSFAQSCHRSNSFLAATTTTLKGLAANLSTTSRNDITLH